MIRLNSTIDFEKNDIDITAIGEILIDMISEDYVDSLKEAMSFNRYFGGSPGNLAINSSKLGLKTAVISNIGDDSFGEFALETLIKEGVDTRGISIEENNHTTMVLVSKSKDTPMFQIIRGADKNLDLAHGHYDIINNSKILHFTAWALSYSPIRETTIELIKHAKKLGKIISFDPNYRKKIWDIKHDGREFILDIIKYVDIIKPSEDDVIHLFGIRDNKEIIDGLLNLGVKLVVLTLGKKGLMASDGWETIKLPSFAKEVVDTTGAGDAFWAGFYTSILNGNTVKNAIEHGSYVSAYKLRHIGAICNYPSIKEIIKKYEGDRK